MAALREKQLTFLAKQPLAHGGELRRARKGRKARPLSTRDSMHLVLRSTRAQGRQAFSTPENRHKVEKILQKFARKNGIKLHSAGNAGNHLHLHIQLRNRHTYKAFIRALTAAIAMAITGASRWKKLKEKFWDYRPFSRVVKGRKGFLTLKDYVEINDLEGKGISRVAAEWIIRKERAG